MLAQLCNLEVGDFVWSGGDCHIYNNHTEQVKQQLERTPVAGPVLQLPEFTTLTELLATKTSAYALLDYDPMPTIKAPMAV
jgi:thymidylate synthase